MNSFLSISVLLLVVAVVWLLPLYWVCKYAERERKNHQVVGLVGLFTGWLIALILVLFLPVLDEKALADLRNKSARQPLGQTGIILGVVGVCVLALGGVVLFVAAL